MAEKAFPVTVGIAAGIGAGLFFFIIGVFGSYSNFGHSFITAMGSIFIGYNPSWTGGFIAMVWAYLYFFVFGTVITWIYNLLT